MCTLVSRSHESCLDAHCSCSLSQSWYLLPCSADLRHWTAPALAFNRTLTRAARFPVFLFPAAIRTADRLERPQLLFDERGKLTHGFFGMKLDNATPSMNALLSFESPTVWLK